MAEKIFSLIGYISNTTTELVKDGEELTEFESIETSDSYCKFRSQIALKRYALDDDDGNNLWTIYECGPKQIDCPVIFLPPVSGTADIFFYQMLYLCDRGHRVISAEYPDYFSIDEFITGFDRFIQSFQIRRAHIFGASLGGYLAQKYAEKYPERIASLILCNTFADTTRFRFVNTIPLIWINPSPVLRKIFITNRIPEQADERIRAAYEFMSTRLSSLTHKQLVARLHLNLTENYVQPDNLQSLTITIIDVFDECSNSESTRIELYKMYPNARLAHLKSGGNYPYLSRRRSEFAFIGSSTTISSY
ncbi:abhydrolase domain-containing protein [Dermatophagoides farinae]|uniref:Maspardin n=1 Tax=Dermatophagoides farinae TaxID=6954 RepID=A0A9D4SK42_DERFA|nr:maspardin-like [Dermatophagoides farinae]KAH7644286.1 abhydrolase domain-containing protein [Dermatophagoides farinae]